MSIYNNIICPLTTKMFDVAFIAHDGYVYEKEAIEELFKDKELIKSPLTGLEMKVGGIIFTTFNKYLEQFFIKNLELNELRYKSITNIINKFNVMINDKN